MSAPARLDFAEFERQCLKEGFDQVLERVWRADEVLATHTHEFSLKALVVEGEMWLTVGDDTRHLLPGAVFELARDVAHAERYGPAGATYWVARNY